jgi:hypothetical protein
MNIHQVSQELEPATRKFYSQTLTTLREANIPFLVGGAYAFERYTGITRHTKDLDLMIRPSDVEHTLEVLEAAGYQAELTFPHWLAKASKGDDFIDVIFKSGNGIAEVNDAWFEHAVEDTVLNVPVKLCPVEEILLTKMFIMERERYDGADVAHLLLARADQLDWQRLMNYMDENWRVLLSHLILFGFIYPGEQARIPQWIMQELMQRLEQDLASEPPTERLCRGTFLSRAQYLVDIEQWGYRDARLQPTGTMTADQIEHWTDAIDQE